MSPSSLLFSLLIPIYLLLSTTNAFVSESVVVRSKISTTITKTIATQQQQQQQHHHHYHRGYYYSNPRTAIQLTSTVSDNESNQQDTNANDPNVAEKIAAIFSMTANRKMMDKVYNKNKGISGSSPSSTTSTFPVPFTASQFVTFIRVFVPSIIAGVVAFVAFPQMSLWLCSLWNDAGVFAVLSQDSSQFVQNFLTVAGLLFSILVGQTYYFMYQQQEMVYYALFNEVTEAKSLLEQVALVCQGRTMYPKVLNSIHKYVQEDLKQLQADPAFLLSARPMDDPLETIMYLTSVGVPSMVYETIRSLRQARAQRLGALQRKLPPVHMLLLWILGAIELVSFPLLGAGTQSIGGYNVLTVEGCLFGVMTAGIVLTLRVVGELWRPAGGAYNVDNVLSVMISGLERELQARMDGKVIASMRGNHPSPAVDIDTVALRRAKAGIDKSNNRSTTINKSSTSSSSTSSSSTDDLPIQQQGANIAVPIRRLAQWMKSKRQEQEQQK